MRNFSAQSRSPRTVTNTLLTRLRRSSKFTVELPKRYKSKSRPEVTRRNFAIIRGPKKRQRTFRPQSILERGVGAGARRPPVHSRRYMHNVYISSVPCKTSRERSTRPTGPIFARVARLDLSRRQRNARAYTHTRARRVFMVIARKF